MRKISMVVLVGLLGTAALAAAAVPPAAVPQSTAPQVAQTAPWLPAEAKAAAADPLASLFPSQQTCSCIIGDHCCLIGGKQKC